MWNKSEYEFPLSLGDARRWARRFRRLGFSPVTLTLVPGDPNIAKPAGYHLHCRWPYDVADLPTDMYYSLARVVQGYWHMEVQWEYDGLVEVWTRAEARRIYQQYAAVRLGRGSRSIPPPRQNDLCGEAAEVVPPNRIAWGFDSWPTETQRHPDWEDYLQANQDS